MTKKAALRRIVSASFLFFVSTASAVYAQSVSVPFPEGFIGTVGTSKSKADSIQTFTTLDIDRATFSQNSTTGLFTAQGNDIPGTLRLVLDNGTTVDIPGAINWRDTNGSTLNAFGFIPDPAAASQTITYGTNGQLSLTLNSSSNYGLRLLGSSVTYVDGTNISGNAATNGLLDALNNYLTTVQANGPKITGPSGAAGATTSNKAVNENQTAVATLTADRTVTWSIAGGTDAGKFTISPTTGAITFTAAPDFEAPTDSDTNNTYVLTVLATDANGYTGQQTVTVTVANVDEIAPVITGPSGAAGAASSAKSVPENQTAIATFTANETVTWSITGGADAAKFTVNPTTGALTFVVAPDFEIPTDGGTNNVYDLIITAKDTANNTSSQSVAVTVTNLDEVAPQITGPSGVAGDASSAKSVNENQTAVATLSANETVTWSVIGGADQAKFTINPTTGALTFTAAPDFEAPTDNGANNVYDVIVRAVDTAGNASQQSVAVTVLNLDEVAPSITGPSGAAGAATSAKSVPENQTAIATFTANETVSWSITGGLDSAKFAIDPSTGALTFLAAPDFETPTDNGTNNVYDVVITAKDVANNTSSQSVAVTVTNLDEVAPKITGPSGAAGAASSAKSVNEGTTAVAMLTADEAVTWSIVGGADQAKFTINSTTGALTFLAAPDYETPTDNGGNNVYDVVLRAVDAANNASQQSVAVTVLNLDEVAPQITGPSGGTGASSSAKSVNENQTAVATLTADETVTWSITGGSDAAKFAIDPATGALTFLAAPDYETPADAGTDNVYDVIVTAKDTANNTSSQSVAVTVLNLDEVAPQITGPSGGTGAASSAKTVDENQTAVATFTADEGITWAISGTDAAKFSIDPSTGALTFVAAPDYEVPTDSGTNNVYDLMVTAKDAAGNVSQQAVTVTVANLDEMAPQITGPSGVAGAASSAKSVNEGTTAVAALIADESVTWSITGGADAAKFTVDPATGALTFLAAPDFEAPTDSGADNVYEVVLSAEDASNNISTQSVAVTVLNLDDTAPVLSGATTTSVPENQTALETYTADEAVTWAVVGGPDQAKFTIHATTGALSFVAAPDFEAPSDAGTNNVYDVVLEATDGAGNKTQRTVAVTVTDLDDVAPGITGPSGSVGAATSATSVTEGTPAVYSFAASEGVTWALVGGADQAKFAIDPATGALRFASAPDYEAPADADADNTYIVVVEAKDASGNASLQTVTVTVTDVAEDTTPPSISGPSGSAGAGTSTKTVNEGQTTVTTFTADEGVTWSISSGNDQGRFAINAATGALTFVAAPDYEVPVDVDTNNTYVVVVTATDGFGNTSQQTLTVTVADLDDTAPQITGPSGGTGAGSSILSVNEGTTAVHTFSAGEPVTWTLVGGNDQGRFAINPSTGALTFVAAPDYESPADADTNNTYVLIVEAKDADGNTSQQTVTVTVLDLDDSAPQITGPSGGTGAGSSATSVNEGTTAVVSFVASEGVTWSLTGGADQAKFAIDPATGAVTFVTAPDFDQPGDANADNAYVVVVTATDGNGNTSQQTLTITVLDLDDTAPAISGPSGGAGAGASATSVNEGSTAVVSFSANEGVTWSITGGADGAKFAINLATGALTFVTAPNYEAPNDANNDNAYVVVVTATDTNGNTSQQTVTVTVLDLDDTAPQITGPSGSAGTASSAKTVIEGTTAVATFTAGEPVTWSLVGGPDQARFALDPTTGALTFVAAPDFEQPTDSGTDNTYVLIVEAKDANGNTSQQTVTITVTNVAEDTTPPAISGPSGSAGAGTSTRTVNEGQTSIATFVADEGVTWSVTGGNDRGEFTIDPATGALTFVAAPDYEAPSDGDVNNTYIVVITATDGFGNTSQQTLTVTVADIDEAGPSITGPSGGAGAGSTTKSVQEGTTTVHTFIAGEPVTWALVGGTDQGRFVIDPSTGVLTFVAAPDFEQPTDNGTDNTYLVTVEATDANGNTSQQTVTITVADVDEDATPPAITGPSGTSGAAASVKTVDEGDAAVATFAANEGVTWSIAGGPDGGVFTIDPSTGVLRFTATPDFEQPADTGRDNIYVLIVEATDADGNISQQTVTVTVANRPEDTTPPEVTGPSGSGQQQAETIPEGETVVATFTSNEEVTWSLGGDGDGVAFTIDPVTGELTFVTPPDFDAPTDSDGDNVYLVTVIATDPEGNRTELTIAVTVTDTGAPAISGPSGSPGAGASATTVNEDTSAVATFTADEAVTWSVTGGPDAGRFAIDPATGELTFVAPPNFEAPTDSDANNVYVVVITATDANGNTSQQTVTVRVVDLTDTPAELFDEHRDDVEAIIKDVEENHLQAAIAAQQTMTRNARDRFIESQRLRELCHNLDDPNRPVTSALRDEDECSLLATRNNVPLDVDGELEAGSNRIFGSGTFFGQTGNFEGTQRRIIEGEFQFIDNGEGIATFDASGRIAWEQLVSENVMLGAFLGGSVARSDVERDLSGSVDKTSLSFGTYVVAEPVDNLYVDGFLSLGAGRNELALSDDELELEGDYTTRSFLVGGAISGVIERERFEIRPELSVAYGFTDIGDLDLDATAFGTTDDVTATIDGVDYATVRFTPEFLVPLERLSDDTTLTVAPSLVCEWMNGEQECGGGLRLGLQGTSRDGMTGWNVSVTADRVGDRTRTGIEASIEHKF